MKYKIFSYALEIQNTIVLKYYFSNKNISNTYPSSDVITLAFNMFNMFNFLYLKI